MRKSSVSLSQCSRQTRSHRTSRLSSRSFQSVRLQKKVMPLLTSAFIQSGRMSWTRCCSVASGRCKLLSAVSRLIYSLLVPAVKTTESIVATVVTIIDYQGGCGSEGVLLLHLRWGCREHFVSGAGTPLGATAVVTPGSAGYLLWECCILASL